LIKYCIEKEKRCYLIGYSDGAKMMSLIMTVVGIASMALTLSLSAYMYKWEQQHLEAESIAEEYIYTCRKAAYTEIHTADNEIPRNQMSKLTNTLSSCDENMLYYEGRCELDPTKIFCSNSALDGYLMLRGIENVERPVGFTKT
jgi:hypothetical protein